MLRGKEAVVVLILLIPAGCTTPAKRSAAPAAPPSARLDRAPNTPKPADITPVSYEQPAKPGAPTPIDPDPLARLLRDAEQTCAQNNSYICRLRRREVVLGRQKPEEVIIFKCRSHPFSVHFKWLGDEGKGREVIYVAGRDDKLHILTAAGDIPLTPAGRRLDLPADSLLVKSASKYPITEAGVCRMVARFGRQLDDMKRGAAGLTVKYLGSQSRPEYAGPLEMVEIHFPPGREPEAPQGGHRLLGFDPTIKWPVFSMTFDPSGREIDYYCFDRFQLNVRLDDDDFNADKMWPVKGGSQ